MLKTIHFHKEENLKVLECSGCGTCVWVRDNDDCRHCPTCTNHKTSCTYYTKNQIENRAEIQNLIKSYKRHEISDVISCGRNTTLQVVKHVRYCPQLNIESKNFSFRIPLSPYAIWFFVRAKIKMVKRRAND
jgi:hypothetical protein